MADDSAAAACCPSEALRRDLPPAGAGQAATDYRWLVLVRRRQRAC
eukprot:CAMPEP_0168458166 /NCGR_PEP_ID=MMETSP0228-20121227/52235_1 /TAXON_ID=133427 /ORGANISM="Protoceratium reticulatum, Strain CCCM 535 (=CCMP 1889)" /LENGTH=45 /DNA_ID= /DNA_START= /DNA_END= /DNA_ORIENTATION=